MIIKQIKVGTMAVFSYIVGCEEKKEGVIIDPGGEEQIILNKVKDLGFTVEYIINTHSHPDHTCGNKAIADATGAKIVIHRLDAPSLTSVDYGLFSFALGGQTSPSAQVLVDDEDIIKVGNVELKVIHTPGHTPGSICLYTDKNLFTGDTLFVEGIGRTDLPGGSMDTLIKSIKEKILTLPHDTIVWPGHDYGDTPTSSLLSEKQHNLFIKEFILSE
ncbi:MAG TPA: MBL fold metallo-hydrolase [Syntrophaceae bacterium]|nr:MBL fold metallo-hydrolase [Syntrophaceae bacterium]